MKSEGGRRRVLDNTLRLEDFDYNDNSMDAPTPKETEEEQQKADELQYEHLMRYHKAKDFLDSAKYADNLQKRVNWLGKLGYEGVNVEGYAKSIPFDVALKMGYSKNIYKMFENERKRLCTIIKESSKYLFLKPGKNNN